MLKPGPHPLLLLEARHSGGRFGGNSSLPHTANMQYSGLRYTLSSRELLSSSVQINGKDLNVSTDGTVPTFHSDRFNRGEVSFAPATISVLTFASAENGSCKRR